MKKILIISMISLLTFNQAFADCQRSYEKKARIRAELIKNTKKAGLISSTVVLGAVTYMTLPFFFVAGVPGLIIVPLVAAGEIQGLRYLIEKTSDVRLEKNNKFYHALATITAAKEGLLTEDFIRALDKEISLTSLSEAEQSQTLLSAVEIIKSGSENNLFCSTNKNGKIKVFSNKKILNHVVEALKN